MALAQEMAHDAGPVTGPRVHTLSIKSRQKMAGVHPDLVRVVERAIDTCECDFMVVEGLRAIARQKQLVATGKSTTMNSRHLTGHAVDLCALVDGKDVWTKPYSGMIARAMKLAAAELDVDLEWGGDWKSFHDTPHFQLSHASYPKQDENWKSAPPLVVASIPSPAPVAKTVRKTSRKWRILDWLKGLFGGSAVGTAGFASAADVGAAKTYLDTLSAFISAYGVMLLIIVCVGGFVLSQLIQNYMLEDAEEGRYTPSGEAT